MSCWLSRRRQRGDHLERLAPSGRLHASTLDWSHPTLGLGPNTIRQGGVGYASGEGPGATDGGMVGSAMRGVHTCTPATQRRGTPRRTGATAPRPRHPLTPPRRVTPAPSRSTTGASVVARPCPPARGRPAAGRPSGGRSGPRAAGRSARGGRPTGAPSRRWPPAAGPSATPASSRPSERDHQEHDRGQAAWPEPADEEDRQRLEPLAQERDARRAPCG